tara:strand:+ start:451 stop:633 length:183 start_codon:yes stop_codon:yes gene_type:complete
MQIGDLVKMRNVKDFRSGIVVDIDFETYRGCHVVRVHFLGHKHEKLNGLHWCDPRELEAI